MDVYIHILYMYMYYRHAHGIHDVMCVCYTGVDCVIVKSGRRICGTGAALANAPLVQDKSYFEVKIQCGGQFSLFTYTSSHSNICSMLCNKGR